MLVSVMLCTHSPMPNAWLEQAIQCYLKQDWKDKELVVVDSGRCRPLFDVVPKDELVYFGDEPGKHNLSVKRNIGIHISRGEVIVHFDYDDWQAPNRVTHQVTTLMDAGVDVAGYQIAHWWDDPKQQASYYIGAKDYTWGACMCYRREYGIKHAWPTEVDKAEDNYFVSVAKKLKTIKTVDGRGYMVCRTHAGNHPKPTNTSNWPLCPLEELPLAFRKIIDKA